MSEEANTESDEVPFGYSCDAVVFHLFGTIISASAVFDLVAVAQPAVRADWSDLMQSMGRVQRCIHGAKWAELPLGVAALITDLGLTLTSGELAKALDETIFNAQKYGGGVAFSRLAAYLVRCAA